MVKFIILILLIIYSCGSLRTQEKNKLGNIVELRLNLPDKVYINDTLEVEVVIKNRWKKRYPFTSLII